MKITIETNYTATSHTTVELPDGKTWDDVEDFYVKWGVLRVRFKGSEAYQDFDTDEVSLESTDFKYPDRTVIWHTDKDGYADYDQEALAMESDS